MYEDPIIIFHRQISDEIIKQTNDGIIREIQHQIGVDINKDELIKALNYDRDQFNKGYRDGYQVGYNIGLSSMADMTQRGEWIYSEPWKTVKTKCSLCGHDFTEYICGYEWEETGDLPNFCPNCGAKMMKEAE